MAYRKNSKTNEEEKTQELPESQDRLPVVLVDYEKYAHFLDGSDASEQDKRKLVETLWNITMMFVDMGFGVHPVQQAQEACGKADKKSPESLLTAPNGVKSRHAKLIKTFENARKSNDEASRCGVDQ